MDDQLPMPTPPIQEGEIIEPATSVLDLTGLINSHLSQITRLKAEAGKLKDMLDGIFINDSVYQAHDTAAREAAKVRAATKKQILKQPQAADLAANIQDLRNQIKERNQELSDYLQEYSRTTGTNSFETEDGQVKQIISTSRLMAIGG